MHGKFKAKLIEVLRSGHYEQAHGALRRGDCFCVLGVMCDLVAPQKWDGSLHDGNMMSPGFEVRQETGITEREIQKLMHLNDTEMLSFNQIATYLSVTQQETGDVKAIDSGAEVGQVQADAGHASPG